MLNFTLAISHSRSVERSSIVRAGVTLLGTAEHRELNLGSKAMQLKLQSTIQST
jgi:hypothetical protein